MTRMTRTPHDAAALKRDLEGLPGWSLRDGKLHREFVFRDFVEAFGWMTKVATVAEEMNHHPDWSNVYKTVRVDLSTHDAGGVTDLDVAMARRMDALREG